ncbi:flavonoid 3'-monooxygenase CYP75B137-like [Mangifera indica]|uniref:flavonoid 3'-monooxygenase CYP75B137-like n=1 Tax=Mangifera indica TaxID=29780 RepID=UPI001CFABF60|nr:flavonoid 3'-monooxygenase CYP75B137-like [Mangifera indica]
MWKSQFLDVFLIHNLHNIVIGDAPPLPPFLHNDSSATHHMIPNASILSSPPPHTARELSLLQLEIEAEKSMASREREHINSWGQNVDVKGRDLELIPFSGGQRICPGLPLAIEMLHIKLALLLHAFDWKHEDGITPEELDMEDEFGFILQKAKPLLAIPVACK